MCISTLDRNPLVQITADNYATALKGWASARGHYFDKNNSLKGLHGVKSGSWYFEVKIINNDDDAHCRVGWTRREAYMDWAVGTDEFGYGYRDASGEAFHNAIPHAYGDSFATGDVIGCLIQLGDQHSDPQIDKLVSRWPMATQESNRVVIKYKGNTFFESRDYAHYDVESCNALLRMPCDDGDTMMRGLRTKNVSKQIKNRIEAEVGHSYQKQFKRLLETYPLNDKGTCFC